MLEPATAKTIALLPGVNGRAFPELGVNGGHLAGINIAVSDQLSAGQVVAFDARSIGADPGVVGLDASDHGSIDMSGGNTPSFSLWQKDCRALRAERMFGFSLLRNAVASVSGASYGESP